MTTSAVTKLSSRIALLAALGLATAACSNLNMQQQRALSGGAIGAAAGAGIGLLTGHTVAGALLGAAAGTAGGLIVHDNEKNRK